MFDATLVLNAFRFYFLAPFNKQLLTASSCLFQNASVCLPLQVWMLDSVSSKLGNRTSQFHYSNLINYFHSKNWTREQFLNDAWGISVRQVIHTYLAIMSLCETLTCGTVFGFCTSGLKIDCDILNNQPPWGTSLLQGHPEYLGPARIYLEKKLKEMDISIEELRQKFGSFVASLLSFRVYHTHTFLNNTYSFKNVEITRTQYVGNDYVCYEVELESYSLTIDSRFDFVAITPSGLASQVIVNYGNILHYRLAVAGERKNIKGWGFETA